LEKIAEKLGKAPSTVSNLARLLQLPENARQALQSGKISEGHARAILALKGQSAKQQELLSSILNNGWSVRTAEQFANAAKRGQPVPKAAKPSKAETVISQKIAQKLGAPVKIRRSSRGGQIIIHFQNDQKLAELSEKLDQLS
jgi:ParB family chromosome partitioning protein